MCRLSGGTRSVCSIKADALQFLSCAAMCEFLEVHLVFVQKKLICCSSFVIKLAILEEYGILAKYFLTQVAHAALS